MQSFEMLTNHKDDVVSKPFRIPELIPKIELLVAKYGATNSRNNSYR